MDWIQNVPPPPPPPPKDPGPAFQCPKCKSRAIHFDYHGTTTGTYKADVPGLRSCAGGCAAFSDSEIGEHFCVLCCRCKYTWAAAVLAGPEDLGEIHPS